MSLGAPENTKQGQVLKGYSFAHNYRVQSTISAKLCVEQFTFYMLITGLTLEQFHHLPQLMLTFL